tara:strand:- start:2937 stop:3695 length:759 start_codon:yes stop_codon:yes gene_type:complete
MGWYEDNYGSGSDDYGGSDDEGWKDPYWRAYHGDDYSGFRSGYGSGGYGSGEEYELAGSERRDFQRDADVLRAACDSPWSCEEECGEEQDEDRSPYLEQDLDGLGYEYIPGSTPPNEYEEDESELEALREEGRLPLEEVARRLVERSKDVFLSPAAAAQALGYEEIDASFRVGASGGRAPVGGAALPAEMRQTPYDTLRAFDSGSSRGWGVVCTEDITAGDVVVEMVGRLLSEAEFEQVRAPSPVQTARIDS